MTNIGHPICPEMTQWNVARAMIAAQEVAEISSPHRKKWNASPNTKNGSPKKPKE